MIYLDYNATTPILDEVREAMNPFLGESWGNPSSSYRFGAQLKSKIESAREQTAALIGSKFPREVLFTGGGTESNNTAIHAGIMSRAGKKHIITSVVEHSSVLTYCRFLEKYHGYRITWLPVDSDGLLDLAELVEALTEDTALVSLMWANNETGVLFPIAEASQICRSRDILFHCDAVQAVGKLAVDVQTLPIDYLSLTGHKLGAPKGIGVLYVHRQSPFVPFVHGGHQERARRGGTENVASIVGLGTAAAHALKKLAKYDWTIRPLRDQLEQGLLAAIPEAELNGHPELRLANTSNLTFYGVESEALLLLLDQAGICASSGSACLADSPDPSHVIAAMKRGPASGQCVRFSLGIPNTAADIRQAVADVARLTHSLRH